MDEDAEIQKCSINEPKYASLKFLFDKLPPSINSLWCVRGARIKVVRTGKYNRYLNFFSDSIRQQSVTQEVARRNFEKDCQIPIQVKITVILNSKREKTRDLDNFLKPIMDALVHSKLLKNDTCVQVSNISLKAKLNVNKNYKFKIKLLKKFDGDEENFI